MKYANQIGYSDVTPYEVIRTIGAKTFEVRQMKCERDPSWNMDIEIGGFLGHVHNQRDQKWFIDSDPQGYTCKIRLHKDGYWRNADGAKFSLNDHPVKFYDFNF